MVTKHNFDMIWPLAASWRWSRWCLEWTLADGSRWRLRLLWSISASTWQSQFWIHKSLFKLIIKI